MGLINRALDYANKNPVLYTLALTCVVVALIAFGPAD